MTSRLPSFAILAAAILATGLPAQESSPDVAGLKAKFLAERADALEKKFPATSLERADEQAKRAEEAVKTGTSAAAAKLYREARWLIPYVPNNLPPHVDRVLGIARMRHGDIVTSVAFSPDGNRLASCSSDSVAKIWDLANGRELRGYRGSKDAASEVAKVATLAWSSDGKWSATTAGNEVHVWDPETGVLKVALKGHEKPVGAIAFHPEGKILATGSDDASVRLWDLETGKETFNLNADLPKAAKATVNAVAFSPNGKLVAAVNKEGKLQIWNPALEKSKRLVSGLDAHPHSEAYQVAFGKDTSVIFTCGSNKKVQQWVGLGPDGESLPGHGKPTTLDADAPTNVEAMAVSRDGRFLAAGGTDKAIRLWDLTAGKLARVFQGHTDKITALAFSPDGKTLVSGSGDQSIRLWAVSFADDHQNFAEHTGFVWSAAFSADGKMFASAGADKTIYVRDPTGKHIHKLIGHTAPVTAIAFSPDSTILVSVGGDRVIRLWDARAGKQVKEWAGHTSPVMAVAFSGDGKMILTGGIDKIARLWDATKDAAVYTFPAGRTAISAVALRADGKQALIGSGDGQLRVFDLTAAPKEMAVLTAHYAGVGAIAYGTDATKFATCGGDGLVKYWTVPATGIPTLVHEFKGHTKPVSSVAISADGRFLVSGGGDAIVRVWDVASKTELRALRGHADWVSSVAFGPNGRTILSASVDKTVKVWELSGEETAKAIGHSRQLNTIAVSADGRWIASGSDDKTIKVWDAVSGTEAFTLDADAGGHTAKITALAFEPNGKRLISAAADGKLIIWDMATKKPTLVMAVDQDVPFLLFSTKGDRFIAWQSSANGDNQTNNVKTYSADGKPLASFDDKTVILCMSFSPDGGTAVMGNKAGAVRVWDLDKNERVGGDWPAFDKSLSDLGIAADKKTVAAIDSDGTVKLYDVAAKKLLKTFSAHPPAELLGLVISPDGKLFATFSGTGEVKVWKLDGGDAVRAWSLPTSVRSLAFSADGKKLISANGDTTLYVLNLP